MDGSKLRSHDLRRVFTTTLTDNDADIRDVQALPGHSSVTVTEIYTGVNKRGAEKALTLQRRIK
jgi:site-specific recombinase XerD